MGRHVAILWSTLFLATAVAAPADRPTDPVVLTGAELPTLLGVVPGNVVAFRFDGAGSWVQIPVQVDERIDVDFGQVYDSAPIGRTFLTYADAGTFTGPDADPAFDADDEVVLLAAGVGSLRWDGSAEPAGVVAGSLVELRLDDPLDGGVGWVYLFESDGTLDPGAGAPDVGYVFDLLSGDYKTTYNLEFGPNPEDSRVTTPDYTVHFSDRWIRDETGVTEGGAPGTDILDGHKILFAPGNCARSVETFSAGEGAFIVNRTGPLRALRGYLGANSGPNTYRIHRFYPSREETLMVLRVHDIPGLVDFFDYSPAAAGMTYANDLNPAGVTIDGQPDVLAPGEVGWERVSGSQGSLAIVFAVDTDIPAFDYTWFNSDDDTPANQQCTGDGDEYGASGFWEDETIPNTDPDVPNPVSSFETLRVIDYGAQGLGNAFAESLRDRIDNPLVVAVNPSNPCPDLDDDGWAVCAGACNPDPADVCGDCDDGSASINPGAVEGWDDAPTCDDAVDNDCDADVDAGDTGCALTSAFVDFGPASTPPDGGYVRDDGSPFDPASGFGWATSSSLPTRERVCGIAGKLETFAFSSVERVWEIEVVNGDYDVTVALGDCAFAQGPQRLSIEDASTVDGERTAAGEHLLRSRTVPVRDGRLSVAVGGAAGFTTVNYVEVVPAGTQPATLRSINFQPDDGLAPRGFETDNGAPFDPARGRGWSRDLGSDTRRRGAIDEATRDTLLFVGASAATYRLEVPADTYLVTVSAGDARFAQGPHRVVVEGVPAIEGASTGAGQFVQRTVRVQVLDGVLDVEAGGSAGLTTLNFLSLAPATGTSLRVNFQPLPATVPAGYVADDGAPFGLERGFGWARSRTGDTRLRGLDPDLRRDTLLFVGGTAGRWEAVARNGDYEVVLSVGDARFGQGPHHVTVEGASVFAGETTAPGEFAERSVTVAVRDGRLTVDAGGGATGFTTLNFLDLRPLPQLSRVNFQPVASATPAGFVADSGQTYDALRGYGWSRDVSRDTRERGLLQDASLDTLVFAMATGAVWRHDLPPGDYQVVPVVGDAAFRQGPQRVVVEGATVIDGVFTTAGMFRYDAVCVSVADGRLEVEIGELSGATVLTSVSIAGADCTPP